MSNCNSRKLLGNELNGSSSGNVCFAVQVKVVLTQFSLKFDQPN